MQEIRGNLIQLACEGRFDVVVHGCNCFCVMGAGIARHIKRIFPQAYAADVQTSPGDDKKLGSYSSAEVSLAIGHKLIVVNAYTQYGYKNTNTVQVNYGAVRSVMRSIKKDFSGLTIGYPKIGCGLGGGDWNVVSKIIDEELEGENHWLVLLDQWTPGKG